MSGLLLIPLALVSPQTLSAGHGALHLDLVLRPALSSSPSCCCSRSRRQSFRSASVFAARLFFASLFTGVADRTDLRAGLVNIDNQR